VILQEKKIDLTDTLSWDVADVSSEKKIDLNDAQVRMLLMLTDSRFLRLTNDGRNDWTRMQLLHGNSYLSRT
jgi:hypothetical protein